MRRPEDLRVRSEPVEQEAVEQELPTSDARLVEEVRRGNTEAFGTLVTRYEKKLHAVIHRMVRDPEQARDLAQEAFLRVYQHIDQFDTSRRFGPWLFRVGVNLSVDWLRRAKPVLRLSQMVRDENAAAVADPDPRPRIELSQEVQAVLEQIPLRYRTVLILRDLEGFSCSEVAAIEGRREATVRWRLSRAREMFRGIWERRQERGEHGLAV
jgi:RNA polymerase sigma-70 factor (ECF subfamily)